MSGTGGSVAPQAGQGGGLGGGGGVVQGGSAQTGGASVGGDEGVAGDGGEPSGEPLNIVFVTSKRYAIADLGGVEGADAECNALAKAAGHDGKFVAFLSTSEVDAKERLGSASGWMNTQGLPFANSQAELFAGAIYYPIRYDQKGVAVSANLKIATGTTSEGVSDRSNCDDWSGTMIPINAVVTGNPTAGSELWVNELEDPQCYDGSYGLYCFQTDHRARAQPMPVEGRTVFVSSEPLVIGPDGIDGADAQCAADAEAAELPGTYIALLSTTQGAYYERLLDPTRAWIRPDGSVIEKANGLFTSLEAAITEFADGTYVGGELIWSSLLIGSSASSLCGNWTDTHGQASALGMTGMTDGRWNDYGRSGACNERWRFLCAQR